jgi:hypothetical protein
MRHILFSLLVWLIIAGLFSLCVWGLYSYYQKIENKIWKIVVGIWSGIFTVAGGIQILSLMITGKFINLD